MCATYFSHLSKFTVSHEVMDLHRSSGMDMSVCVDFFLVSTKAPHLQKLWWPDDPLFFYLFPLGIYSALEQKLWVIELTSFTSASWVCNVFNSVHSETKEHSRVLPHGWCGVLDQGWCNRLRGQGWFTWPDLVILCFFWEYDVFIKELLEAWMLQVLTDAG